MGLRADTPPPLLLCWWRAAACWSSILLTAKPSSPHFKFHRGAIRKMKRTAAMPRMVAKRSKIETESMWLTKKEVRCRSLCFNMFVLRQNYAFKSCRANNLPEGCNGYAILQMELHKKHPRFHFISVQYVSFQNIKEILLCLLAIFFVFVKHES